MPRYFVKSYTDADASEKRFAVERQDGSIHRVLQRGFITEEGASVWLARYKNIKMHKGDHLRRAAELELRGPEQTALKLLRSLLLSTLNSVITT